MRFHRGWASICRYILKEDKEPLVWGEYTRQQIIEIAGASPKLKRSRSQTSLPEQIIDKLLRCQDWYEIYNDELLRKLSWHSYESMRNLYEDLQVVRDMQTTLGERFIEYFERHGQPEEYEIEELEEKYLLLDWIACQLSFHRPIKTKQLFIYGVPNMQKTALFHILSRVLRIYFTSSRGDDR